MHPAAFWRKASIDAVQKILISCQWSLLLRLPTELGNHLSSPPELLERKCIHLRPNTEHLKDKVAPAAEAFLNPVVMRRQGYPQRIQL